MRIFTAPLNSEVEVARNVLDLVRVLGPGKGKDVKVCASRVRCMRPTHLGYSPRPFDQRDVRLLSNNKKSGCVSSTQGRLRN